MRGAALLRSVFSSSKLTIARLPVCVQVKRDVRALRRKPLLVIPPDNLCDEREKRTKDVKEPAKPTKPRHEPVSQALKTEQPHELKYDRATAEDRRLSKVVTISKSKKFRDRHGQILLEGHRLLMDALDAGAVLQTLFFSRHEVSSCLEQFTTISHL